jgi:membrane-associated phospholipid phosphatase
MRPPEAVPSDGGHRSLWARRPRAPGADVWLADPSARLAVGLAALAAAGLGVHDRGVGRREVTVFRVVNELPDGLFVPAWVLMQSGSLGAGPVVAALSWAWGRPRLATRLVLGGVGSWALSKAIKRVYRRPRPNALVAGVRSRGSEAAGLGYVSGHAGVAVALGVAAFPDLGRAARLATLLAVPGVGLCRMYVGAHLPLDVVGGAAMGLAVDAAVQAVTDLVVAGPYRPRDRYHRNLTAPDGC